MSTLDQGAFDEWVAYRTASKYGALSEVGIQRLVKRLERLGDLQRVAVEYSMQRNYQGIFPPKGRMQALEEREMADDDTRLAEVMKKWAQVHRNVTVTPNMVKAYRADLNGMGHEEFERAVQHLDRHAKWFPKPSEIWQAARTEGWL